MAARPPPVPANVTLGRLELRPLERVIAVDGQPVTLGARAFDVLLVLAERSDRVVSKREILDVAWHGLVVEENNLQVQISTLRKVLGADVIATIPGVGYRLRPGTGLPETKARIPSTTEAKLRTNLPSPLPTLHGRDADVAKLTELVERHALVSVVGAGGIGKTLLAQHLLDARRSTYPHGVCWVDLGPLDDPRAVPSTLAAALGIELGSGDEMEGLCASLASLDVLIAVDNAEHLVAAVAKVVQSILAAAPGIHLVVTSQVPLKLATEWVYRLEPLAVPPRAMPASDALEFSSVELFVQRAKSADARFDLKDANASAVVDVCRQLDGLPLALELAAARAPVLGVRCLAQSMQDRLKLLNTSHDRHAPPRQRTLRAALAWSCGLLDEAEEVVFRRLGVFVGSFSLESIERVVPDPEEKLDKWSVLDALAALVDRSLVSVQSVESEYPRYRLLAATREFALERLQRAGETDALRRRHALAMATELDAAYVDRYSGRIGVDAWHGAVAMDLDNARAAAAWAREAGEGKLELEILTGMLYAIPHSLHAECTVVAERCAKLVESDVPAWLACRTLCALSPLWVVRHPARSHRAAREAVALARRLDRPDPDHFELYRALCILVRSPPRPNDMSEGSCVLEEARKLEDPAWPPHRLVYRARAESLFAMFRGDARESLRLNRQVLVLEAASGNENPLALCDIVDAELAAGDPAAAARSGVKLVEGLAGTRKELSLAYAQLNLVAALLALDDIDRARAVAEPGWSLGLRFDLQPYWADYLALLSILESRPRSAAQLLGWADAGYGARDQERAHNEAAAVRRARDLLRSTMNETELDLLQRAGATLREEQIPSMAFARMDDP